MKITIFFLLVFNIVQCFAQINNDSKVYIEKCDYDNCASDTIIFFNDSTFKIDSYFRVMSLEHLYTSGIYTVSDSVISCTSFIVHKRILKVKESIDSYKNRVYEWDYDSTFVYYGRSGYIIELDKNNKQFLDTLFFFPSKEFRLESKHTNSIGFIIYVSNEYAGEYLFTNTNSNLITLWFSDYNYLIDKNNFYLRDFKFIIVNYKTIKWQETGRLYLRH